MDITGKTTYYEGEIAHATNNEAEILAIWHAVSECPAYCRLLIITDSKLAIGWLAGRWKCNNPFIAELRNLIWDTASAKKITLHFSKTKGHADDLNNNQVDIGARRQARIVRTRLLEERRAARRTSPASSSPSAS